MERSGCSSRGTSKPNKVPQVPRRFWTPEEEQALINALKSLRADGWKCDGSFRGGHMSRLESIMSDKFPFAGIAVKHIKSKLQVWKKNYVHVLGLLSSSGGAGVRLDPDTNMIVVDSESVWEEYTKVHRGAAQLRGKPLPWYNNWVDIFGTDRAQGSGAVDVGDVVRELMHASHSKEDEKSGEKSAENKGSTTPTANEDPADEAVSITPPTVTRHAAKSDSTIGKRRRGFARSMESFESLMGKFMDNTSSTLGELAQKLTMSPPPVTPSQDAGSEARVALFEAIEEIPELTLHEQIMATHRLALNKAEMDAFWGMHKEARSRFVRMLLLGRLG